MLLVARSDGTIDTGRLVQSGDQYYATVPVGEKTGLKPLPTERLLDTYQDELARELSGKPLRGELGAEENETERLHRKLGGGVMEHLKVKQPERYVDDDDVRAVRGYVAMFSDGRPNTRDKDEAIVLRVRGDGNNPDISSEQYRLLESVAVGALSTPEAVDYYLRELAESGRYDDDVVFDRVARMLPEAVRDGKEGVEPLLYTIDRLLARVREDHSQAPAVAARTQAWLYGLQAGIGVRCIGIDPQAAYGVQERALSHLKQL